MTGTKGLFFIFCLLPGALCDEWTAWMPQHITALSGSCVLIPCKFKIPNGKSMSNPANGVWIKHASQFKDAGTVVFNSSNIKNTLGGQILGNLIQKNCTTVLDNMPPSFTDKYFFRIETGTFRATFPKSPIKIDVKDSPQKPKLTGITEVMENTLVNLTCTAAAPCHKHPPVLTWTPLLGDHLDQLCENADKTKSVSSVLTFSASHLHHGKTITCTAVYPLQENSSKSAKETRTLSVLFSPKNTKASVGPSDPVEKGASVTQHCSSEANPPVKNFTWFKVTGHEATERGSGQTLSFNVTDSDGGWYYCKAKNQHGTERSANVLLTVIDPEKPSVLKVIGGALGATGILLLTILLLLLWRQRKSAESNVSMKTEDTVGQNNESLETKKAMKTGERTEVLESELGDVQYGELDFSQLRDEDCARRAQKKGVGQESVYSEVRVSERQRQEPQQAVNGIEELYAQVNPKHRR